MRAPDWHTGPVWNESLGPEVGEFCASVGFAPYPEQQLILDDVFALSPVGLSASFEVDVIAARQQLKTGLLKQCALGWLYVLPQQLIVWSAHEFDTSREAFQDMKALIEGDSYLRSLVESITTASGSEQIKLRNGARLKFKARTSGGGVGLTGDKVILDEGWALQPEHLGALLPTLAAVADPQVMIVSSACRARSAHLRDVVRQGRAASDPARTYVEWGAPERDCASQSCVHEPGTDGCALDDRELWAAACVVSHRKNPSLPVIAKLRRSMPADMFMREILVWHDQPAGERLISEETWGDGLDTSSSITGRVVFALDVAPDQSFAAVTAAGYRGDGAIHVEVPSDAGGVAWRPGLEWVVPLCAKLTAAAVGSVVAIVPKSPADALRPGLVAAGVPVVDVPAGDVPAACGFFYAQLAGRQVFHLGQKCLGDAVENVRKHQEGGETAWRFGRRRSSGDITTAYAGALAVWYLVSVPVSDYDVMASIG